MKVKVLATTEFPGLDNIKIYVTNVNLGRNATLKILYEDVTDAQLAEYHRDMTESEYANWAWDDTYVSDLVVGWFGLEYKPEPPEEDEEEDEDEDGYITDEGEEEELI